jgi:hypothetical protein
MRILSSTRARDTRRRPAVGLVGRVPNARREQARALFHTPESSAGEEPDGTFLWHTRQIRSMIGPQSMRYSWNG